ncbi:MAG: xylulokinase [Phycisphaeraceae bacterium]|nr:xylulokinase [Phycisphaeraceae bacterium]
MSYLLGIDIGTSGTKTLVCDTAGKVLATAMSEHDISSPEPGWSEQDPQQWWEATKEATRAVIDKADIDGQQISGVGLSGQMHGSVFLGDGTDPLRPALLWNDQRTAAQCDEIESAVGGREALIQAVGNPALTGFTAPKILWVREHEPEVYDATEHILLPKDYVRLLMTGEYATEVGDASGTVLFDVKARSWNQDVISALEIDADLLPECFESHEVSGRVTAKAAEALGLAEGTPVVGGSGDQPAGAVGNGIVRSGILSATLGTSGVVFAHADEPTYDPGGRVHTMCHAVEGKWCVFGCMLSAGGSFQWLRNHLGEAEVAVAREKGVDPYELLIAEAQAAVPGCEGLFFLPYLTGERCPHPDPQARGGWIGLTTRHNRASLIRSVVEGITFGMADAVSIMAEMGIAADTIRLSGGGARSPFWRQLQADIYGADTATINAQEGPAYGVAILAGVGTGVWKNVPEACDAVIKETERLEPNEQAAEQYRHLHGQYQRLYPALKDEFGRIGQLVSG